MAARKLLPTKIAPGMNERGAPRRRKGEPKKLIKNPHALDQKIKGQSAGSVHVRLLEMSSNTVGVCEAIHIVKEALSKHGESSLLSYDDYMEVAASSTLGERSQRRGLSKIQNALGTT